MEEQKRQLESQDIAAQTIIDERWQGMKFDNMPPRLIHETAAEHMIRIVKMMKHYGFTAEQGHRAVAKHTGTSPREVYTAFMYVGNGEFVA